MEGFSHLKSPESPCNLPKIITNHMVIMVQCKRRERPRKLVGKALESSWVRILVLAAALFVSHHNLSSFGGR